MFKFFEFLEFYDINSVATICRAFHRHDFYLGKMHPISRSNNEEIIEKMSANVSQLNDSNTILIARCLVPTVNGVFLVHNKCTLTIFQIPAFEWNDAH